MNYERFVQWAAGPVSSVVALGATALVHQNISHQTALNIATYALTAGTTYMAHHKWLANMPAWWMSQVQKVPAGVRPDLAALGHQALSVGDDFVQEGVAAVQAEEATAASIQAQSGTPAEAIPAGLAPTPTG